MIKQFLPVFILFSSAFVDRFFGLDLDVNLSIPFAGGLALATLPALASSLLGSKKKNVRQELIEPPEVTEARRGLLDFGKTGAFGDFQAGEDLGLDLGNFDPTDIEQGGLGILRNLIGSELPGELDLATEALQSLLATSPEQIQSQFQPFKTSTERLLKESTDRLKRGSAFAQNLFSTDTIQGLGDVQARGNELLTQRLAELTNQALNRRLQAVPLALQTAGLREDIPLNRVSASQRFGGLDRLLSNARSEAERNEILRQRKEKLLPLDALKATVGSGPSQFGVPQINVPQTSPFQSVFDLVSQIGGNFLGTELQNRFGTPPPPQRIKIT